MVTGCRLERLGSILTPAIRRAILYRGSPRIVEADRKLRMIDARSFLVLSFPPGISSRVLLHRGEERHRSAPSRVARPSGARRSPINEYLKAFAWLSGERMEHDRSLNVTVPRRLHSACHDLTPAEYELIRYGQHPALTLSDIPPSPRREVGISDLAKASTAAAECDLDRRVVITVTATA
jgi:hypothetical protein